MNYNGISQSITLTPFQANKVIKDLERYKLLKVENTLLYQQIAEYKIVNNSYKTITIEQDSIITNLHLSIKLYDNNQENLKTALLLGQKELKKSTQKNRVLVYLCAGLLAMSFIVALK